MNMNFDPEENFDPAAAEAEFGSVADDLKKDFDEWMKDMLS